MENSGNAHEKIIQDKTLITMKEQLNNTRLERLDGCTKHLHLLAEIPQTTEEISTSIITLWPAHRQTKDPNGSLVIEVWDRDSLMRAGTDPAYLFILKDIRQKQ